MRGGSPQVALRVDDGLLAKDPRNVAALINRGDAQTALQQLDAASASYADALRADPQSVAARIGLGRLRLTTDPSAAETLFNDALQRAPRNAAALNNLGIARDLLGRHDEAQAAYRQAIGIDPQMSGAQVNLALSMAMAGRANDATPLLRPLASSPNAGRKLRQDLAAVLAMAGNRSEAEQILAQDLPPDQVSQALAIFTAASAPAGLASAIDAPPAKPATRGAGLDTGSSAAGSEPSASASGDATSGSSAPGGSAPGGAAPIGSGATASVATVSAASVSAASESTAGGSVASAPDAGGPATDGSVPGALANDNAPTGGQPSNGYVAQLSSTVSNEAAAADWRRLQKRMPDLLANRQPILVQSTNAGRMPWRVRTGGFAGAKDANEFCSAVQAQGVTCYVIRS